MQIKWQRWHKPRAKTQKSKRSICVIYYASPFLINSCSVWFVIIHMNATQAHPHKRHIVLAYFSGICTYYVNHFAISLLFSNISWRKSPLFPFLFLYNIVWLGSIMQNKRTSSTYWDCVVNMSYNPVQNRGSKYLYSLLLNFLQCIFQKCQLCYLVGSFVPYSVSITIVRICRELISFAL